MMPFTRVIFNDRGKFFWANDDSLVCCEISVKDLNKNWYVADLFYPDFPNYSTKIHKTEIKELLNKPELLTRFEITPDIKKGVKELAEQVNQ